jgi:hypothetical protein
VFDRETRSESSSKGTIKNPISYIWLALRLSLYFYFISLHFTSLYLA